MPTHAAHILKHQPDYFLTTFHLILILFLILLLFWCAHKAYIRGIILLLCSRFRRQRTKKLNQLLSEIKQLESQNKLSLDTVLMHKLSKLWFELRLLLIDQFDKHLTHL